jgi:hypothetical protein
MKGNVEADEDFKSAQIKLKELTIEISKANESARFWHNASLALCAAGLIWALAQQNFGIYLNGTTTNASKVSQEAPIAKQHIVPPTPSQEARPKPKKIGPAS